MRIIGVVCLVVAVVCLVAAFLTKDGEFWALTAILAFLGIIGLTYKKRA
jgi:peptidoglycan/LPS O-acetylase OafA/YrhL